MIEAGGTSLGRPAPVRLAGLNRTRRHRRRPGIVTAICAAYVVGVVAWQALRFTPVGGWWPFELLDIFGLATFAPLPLFVLLALLVGNRAAGLWLLAPLAVLAWEYGALLLPQAVPNDGTPLRVMTANVLYINAERARVSALITVEQPDIIALQEVGSELAVHLAAALKAAYPHQLLAPSDVPDGLGILSRYPVHVEPETGWYSHACECQRATVEIGGRRVTLVNAHPPPPSIRSVRVEPLPMAVPVGFDRSATTSVLRAALDGIDLGAGPVLLVGDFNTSDRQPLYRELRGELADAHRAAGWGLGYTFPGVSIDGLPSLAAIRIDYVMYNAAFASRTSRTGTMPGSDHHYVVADLLLR